MDMLNLSNRNRFDSIKSKLEEDARKNNVIALMCDDVLSYVYIYDRSDEHRFLKTHPREMEILQKDLTSKASEVLETYKNKKIILVVKNGDFTLGLITVINVCHTFNIELSVLCYNDKFVEDQDHSYFLPTILQECK